MKYEVILTPNALSDLDKIRDYLFEVGGNAAEEIFLNQFEKISKSFETFPHQGNIRESNISGLRIIGIAKRASIAFVVKEKKVYILRIKYKGGDLMREFEK